MKRAFTKRQKKILALSSGNMCEICGGSLTKSFHADHVIPYSKKGKTILNNSQALCEKCNLKKGNK
jgi:5-methylcytosine-specific restriction endonuclease McrA